MLNVVSGLLAGGVAPDAGQFESIQTFTVGAGGQSTISFTSIPSTYKHLQIRTIGRFANNNNGLWINFNGDSTSSNYYAHYLFGAGSGTPVAGAGASTPIVSYWPISTDTASVFGSAVIDILDYANTNKNKTVRTMGGYDANGSGYAWYDSTLWNNTSAISSIDLKNAAGNNFAQYSSFALYGIKG